MKGSGHHDHFSAPLTQKQCGWANSLLESVPYLDLKIPLVHAVNLVLTVFYKYKNLVQWSH